MYVLVAIIRKQLKVGEFYQSAGFGLTFSENG